MVKVATILALVITAIGIHACSDDPKPADADSDGDTDVDVDGDVDGDGDSDCGEELH